MSTFIERFDSNGSGPRLAVKDLIDMKGHLTTAGCKAVADHAKPAEADADCMAGARQAEARGDLRIVGKVNLHELAFGGTGLNPWFGNPINPLDPARIPGGSSSGSAVAVATEEADVAYGSDTGGSVRTPSACCGTAGLKTTWGRVPLRGVWPLSPSLDTVGPMARDVAGLLLGMRLLEPGFELAPAAPSTAARFRGLDVDPAIDAALDRVLAESGLDVVDVDLAGWAAATRAGVTVLVAEAWQSDRRLVEEYPQSVGEEVRNRFDYGRAVTAPQLSEALAHRTAWRAELAAVFARAEVIALPSLVMFPPIIGENADLTVQTNVAVNLAGHPALAVPVPTGGPLPASLQLIGPDGSESMLLAAGLVIEGAAAAL
ncbi:MAG TPA: amidase [Acidimicrobiales bacterium]|nr:amidase [Acidimicrobiales bacterium]